MIDKRLIEKHFQADIKWNNLEKFLEVNCFELEEDTNFPRFILSERRFAFYPGDFNNDYYRTSWTTLHKTIHVKSKVSFEYILENVSVESRKELLWHMDLFI